MSRRADRALRPSVDGLEGRLMLSAGAQRPAMNAPRLTEKLFFDPPSIASQQSTATTVTLNRPAVSKIDSRGLHGNNKGRLSDTLVVHVTSYDPPASFDQNGLPIAPPDYAPPPTIPDERGLPVIPQVPMFAAIPNVHYVPVDETVTFLPGETSKTITVGIIPGAENLGRVALSLKAESMNGPPLLALTLLVIDARPDVASPRIVSSQLVVNGRKATGIAIQFNTPMDVASVTNLNAYELTDISRRPARAERLQSLLLPRTEDSSKLVPLRSATWDASTNTVTLISNASLRANGRYQLNSRRPPLSKGVYPLFMNQAVVPLRDQVGNVMNDDGRDGILIGGFSGLSVTRSPTKFVI